ncbi:MAG: hypothetical protein OXH67_13100 [Acidimicrobiaceae bacterium]|nr:hypothetical protein [Acidimicrobiaceae bacterium]
MFNLLIKGGGWSPSGRDILDADRLFEYTHDAVKQRFDTSAGPDLDALTRLPAVFMSETWERPENDRLARVGSLTEARMGNAQINLRYVYDQYIPPIPSSTVMSELAEEWDFTEWAGHRTHWAVKDVDLYRTLIPLYMRKEVNPSVFKITSQDLVQEDLVSVMMPMDREFDKVYSAIRKAVQALGVQCKRADDVWESEAVMQDVVSLICRSRAVVADCSGRNPNVFYEMGVAHTVGREVVPITQNRSDVPFDIRHLRYVEYLNNKEGRSDLMEQLSDRIRTLIQ